MTPSIASSSYQKVSWNEELSCIVHRIYVPAMSVSIAKSQLNLYTCQLYISDFVMYYQPKEASTPLKKDSRNKGF